MTFQRSLRVNAASGFVLPIFRLRSVLARTTLSRLAPCVFLLYINDLCLSSILLKILLFADDTTIIYSSNDIDELIATTNSELSKLINWFNINKLYLNASKSGYMIFNNQKKPLIHDDVVVGKQTIAKLNTAKFLGVEIDASLKWINHIILLENKLASSIYTIRNIRFKINKLTALKLYDTLI